jgi:hypothetical protein
METFPMHRRIHNASPWVTLSLHTAVCNCLQRVKAKAPCCVIAHSYFHCCPCILPLDFPNGCLVEELVEYVVCLGILQSSSSISQTTLSLLFCQHRLDNKSDFCKCKWRMLTSSEQKLGNELTWEFILHYSYLHSLFWVRASLHMLCHGHCPNWLYVCIMALSRDLYLILTDLCTFSCNLCKSFRPLPDQLWIVNELYLSKQVILLYSTTSRSFSSCFVAVQMKSTC